MEKQRKKGNKNERKYYEIMRAQVEKIFKVKVSDLLLEITADAEFSDELKYEISKNRQIIFSFLKKAPPDITGFIKKDSSSDFIVVDVKREKIKLEHIYQLRKYRDVFNAKFAFLISLRPIPAEIKRLCELESKILSDVSWRYPNLTLVSADEKMLSYTSNPKDVFIDWYPENPFENDLYWE